MRTLGFGEGRQAEQAMPEARSEAQSIPPSPRVRFHGDSMGSLLPLPE